MIFLETISIGSLPVYILTIVNPSSIIDFFSYDPLTDLLNKMSLEQRAFYGLILVVIIFIFKGLYNTIFTFTN